MSHVTVIGAGIVGSCCARFLQDAGHDVVLVDRIEPGMGCSFGNAGIISNVLSATQPPGPRLLKNLPKMLFSPDAGVVIRWRYLLAFAPWLAAMLKGCGSADQERTAQAMAALLTGTNEAYDAIVRGTAADGYIRRNGTIGVYNSEASFAADAWRRDMNAALGAQIEELASEEIRQMEPSLSSRIARATYCPTTYSTTDPARLTRAIADESVARGARFVLADVAGIRLAAGRPEALLTDRGEMPLDKLVVAAGAFSHRLAKMMGIKVLLDTERGYHLEMPEVKTSLSRAVLHYDDSFAMNQMNDGLRFAGTVEFAGVDAPQNDARAHTIWRKGRAALRETEGLENPKMSLWMGRRPTMPDFRPVIGAAPGVADCWFAFGHQHLGLTFGARTGQIVAELVAGRDPGLDLEPFRADRF